jgi:hypothetical protein
VAWRSTQPATGTWCWPAFPTPASGSSAPEPWHANGPHTHRSAHAGTCHYTAGAEVADRMTCPNSAKRRAESSPELGVGARIPRVVRPGYRMPWSGRTTWTSELGAYLPPDVSPVPGL